MKVIILCLILAVAYADHHTGGGRGQTGTYHDAGFANQGNRGSQPNIGGYPGTHHQGQGQGKPGVYHEAGYANQGNRGSQPNIGGYPGTHHVGNQGLGSQGAAGNRHQGGYQTHGY